MRLTALIAAGALTVFSGSASAQSWARDTGYGYSYSHRSNAAPSAFDWRSQLDRPGDYRCDQYWDANRSDCGARWRDQRSRTNYARDDGRYGYGSGYSHGSYGYGSYGHGGYGGGYGYGGDYGRSGGETAYFGAYGRPDLVSSGGGRGAYGYRGSSRADWCRATYRSYDPSSGYYRGYSGRLIYCG